MPGMPSRDDLASDYLDQLPFEPYPVQEEALLSWFSTDDGTLVCAPTGTGKTLIAEAALFEALHTGRVAYYTTPLIALTDQKFQEIQDSAVRWGFEPTDVGLVTGNRKVNPHAKVLVVVAEILLNRLLNSDGFDFSKVSAVVMDEFHSFNDRSRGIVWELSLAMLPKNVRLLLLSATVGNTNEFLIWLNKSHGRKLDLVQGTERKIPLQYHWVEDELLNDQVTHMAAGDEATRRTPMLLFCFNREECWRVAEQLKGKALLKEGQQKQLAEELKQHDWSQGIGPKLKTILLRGVGVHHAGVLPKYKRIVEELFQSKLLSVCVCTETLAAGMNLPARSVLLTALLTGPPRRKKLINSSSAHQMFGRAGRPQFDTEGHVYALAHEDDVKIAKYQLRIDQIPEDTKDPLLIKKRKQLIKKGPKRRQNQQYWGETQFTQLIEAPPSKLQSQGQIPWRLLAYLLSLSPDVSIVRRTISKRLMDNESIDRAQQGLVKMLLTLERGGFITLEPEPKPIDRALARPGADEDSDKEPPSLDAFYKHLEFLADDGLFDQKPAPKDEPAINEPEEEPDAFGLGIDGDIKADSSETEETMATDEADVPAPEEMATEPEPENAPETKPLSNTLKALLEAQGVTVESKPDGKQKSKSAPKLVTADAPPERSEYAPERAVAMESLDTVLRFKSINPIYGTFLLKTLPHAAASERIMALESVLEFPGSLVRNLRIPKPDILPPSPFTTRFLNPQLLTRGLASPTELGDIPDDWDELPPEERVWPLMFPDKLVRLFHAEYPAVESFRIMPVWAAGELLTFNGDFNKLITSRKIARQEGVVFRHVLRFVLLCDEFIQHLPEGNLWRLDLMEISDRLTEACRDVDSRTTDMMVESAKEDDPLAID
jgi:superfamily II DNA/RNA helicase